MVYRESTTLEEFCLGHVFSLTVDYNGAAWPCHCHSLGSFVGESCSSYGGQCRCKTGTTGRRCDQCDLRHYALSDQGCIRTSTQPAPSVVCVGMQYEEHGRFHVSGVPRISFWGYKFNSDYIFTRFGTCHTCCPVPLWYPA